ncbi:Ring finger domain [Phytophthora infestans]|uniref:RING-type E3 ubiquitin transferase n=1 Tax=Phytophthora infestans TaxID=4787 RepID=A0A833SRM2_PHYIN|nr:Ring finger domain [Phytophthora infestans]KAI9986694.1 hypothetical protein PInf_025649 [Phytophthora infestans]
MSTSNDNAPSGPTATHGQPQGNFVFFIPPPPTVWVQFNDGMQMAFTPSPAQFLQSMMHGTPLFGSMPGNGVNGNGSDGFFNALNELFQRAQAQQHGPPPTSKPFLDKLPVKVWTQDMQQTEKHTECVICLSDYEKDDKVLSLPCGHTFHKDCGMTWLVEHNVCPTCRHELPTQVKNTSTAQASTQTTPTASTAAVPAITEPEREPTSQETTTNVTGVRRQRPTVSFHPREVRQRVDEPTSSLDVDVELDHMLEEEADRFVKEEIEKRQISASDENVEIDDRDVDEFFNESRY